ncbi:hypothetical protein [Sulfurovum sp.]|uniref:hypothetical protein n=1 Tax=Sulfurovum sp. TaxID=1969726 RepID=UPI0025E44E06|nr:hypothetical protein [Sulfurovum sp.]
MLDEKQKIRIHKLILEIEKKKKQITNKAIKNYIGIKKAEGANFSFPEIKEKVYEKIYDKDYSKDYEAKLRSQNELLDEVLSADSRMRIGNFVIGGIGILLVIWVISWIISPSEKKNTTSSPVHTERHIDIVSNSGWDGSVYQVEDYLKKTLKDPDSYQSIQWYKVKKTPTGFKVLHEYRAKNSFGGYVVEMREFILDSNGNVIATKKIK